MCIPTRDVEFLATVSSRIEIKNNHINVIFNPTSTFPQEKDYSHMKKIIKFMENKLKYIDDVTVYLPTSPTELATYINTYTIKYRPRTSTRYFVSHGATPDEVIDKLKSVYIK